MAKVVPAGLRDFPLLPLPLRGRKLADAIRMYKEEEEIPPQDHPSNHTLLVFTNIMIWDILGGTYKLSKSQAREILNSIGTEEHLEIWRSVAQGFRDVAHHVKEAAAGSFLVFIICNWEHLTKQEVLDMHPQYMTGFLRFAVWIEEQAKLISDGTIQAAPETADDIMQDFTKIHEKEKLQKFVEFYKQQQETAHQYPSIVLLVGLLDKVMSDIFDKKFEVSGSAIGAVLDAISMRERISIWKLIANGFRGLADHLDEHDLVNFILSVERLSATEFSSMQPHLATSFLSFALFIEEQMTPLYDEAKREFYLQLPGEYLSWPQMQDFTRMHGKELQIFVELYKQQHETAHQFPSAILLVGLLYKLLSDYFRENKHIPNSAEFEMTLCTMRFEERIIVWKHLAGGFRDLADRLDEDNLVDFILSIERLSTTEFNSMQPHLATSFQSFACFIEEQLKPLCGVSVPFPAQDLSSGHKIKPAPERAAHIIQHFTKVHEEEDSKKLYEEEVAKVMQQRSMGRKKKGKGKTIVKYIEKRKPRGKHEGGKQEKEKEEREKITECLLRLSSSLSLTPKPPSL